METYQVFLRMLKSLGCYSEYRDNFKRMPRYLEKYGEEKDFKQFVKKLIANRGEVSAFECFINDSFNWAHTNEGHNYWSSINKEFKKPFRILSGYEDCESSLDAETEKIVLAYVDKLLYDNKIKKRINNF